MRRAVAICILLMCGAPVAAEPQPDPAPNEAPPAEAPMIKKPVFRYLPSVEEIGCYYPERLWRLNMEKPPAGDVLLECRATESGRLEGCEVKQTPIIDLGEAAKAIATRAMELEVNDADGSPVAGRRIRMLVHVKSTNANGDSCRKFMRPRK